MTLLDLGFIVSLLILIVVSVFCWFYTVKDLMDREDIDSFKDLFRKKY